LATVTLERVDCAVCGGDVVSPARVRAPRDDHAGVLDLPDGRSRWVVCDRCGLVFQSPRPGPAAVARLYEGGDYHTTRGGVPEHYIRYSLRRSVAALDWAQTLIPGPGHAIDIGCGVGGALVKLRADGWAVTGIEPDEDLASVARDRFGLDVATGMFDATSFDGDEFDLAYSCHVWEHLADPVATSTAVHALLAPREGYLVIVVPTFRRARTLAWSCFTAPHTYMFTEVSLRNVLVRAGFDIVDHRFHSGADSELWLVARARRRGIPAEHPVVEEDLGTVQRELARVVWRAPLGTPARVATHVRTLLGDPLDFARRGTRWCGRRIERLKRTAGR